MLFRGASEGEIRKGLLQEDLIEAVIGLPTNLFYGTGIPAAILVINRDKPKARKGKVLFVEASREFREGSAQNYLRDEDVKKIAAAAHAFKDVDKYARVVDARGDREERLEPEHQPLRGDRRGRRRRWTWRRRSRSCARPKRARDEAKAVMDGFLRELGYDD